MILPPTPALAGVQAPDLPDRFFITEGTQEVFDLATGLAGFTIASISATGAVTASSTETSITLDAGAASAGASAAVSITISNGLIFDRPIVTLLPQAIRLTTDIPIELTTGNYLTTESAA